MGNVSNNQKLLLGLALFIVSCQLALYLIETRTQQRQNNFSFFKLILNDLNYIVDNKYARFFLDEIKPTFSRSNETGLSNVTTNGTQLDLKSDPPLCPVTPEVKNNKFELITEPLPKTMKDIEAMFDHLLVGGRSKPLTCTSRHRVAIVIPYRNREPHLRAFMLNMHKFLRPQFLDYGIYVIEQNGNDLFNRGMLMNVGVSEALKIHDYQCFVFHDVDLLPEDNRIFYDCPKEPRHMSVAIDLLNYKLPYDYIMGGVTALSLNHFLAVNGYSNMFWGWGGEDDDLAFRFQSLNYNISSGRYPEEMARYKMLVHKKDPPSLDRYVNLNNGTLRMSYEGYNSLKYTVVKREARKLFTWVLVDLPRLRPQKPHARR